MKEKQHEQHVGNISQYFRQTMRIMRLSLFFMVVSTAIAWSASIYSQSTKLSVNLRDATVREVIKAIEEQSEFLFLYQEGQVDLNRRVSIRAEGKQLQEILDEVFKGTDNIYIVSDRQVVIGKAPRKALEAQLSALQKDLKTVIQQPQQKEIRGKVTDTSGEPLPGATVMVKGTTIGTVTDADGNFTLRIPANAQTLQISFVGMKMQEIPIAGRTTFNVQLEEEAVALQEVVAVGYGVQKKESVVGAITNVKGEELLRAGGVTNMGEALQGKLPGVTTIIANNMPGETDLQIFIRGQSSWNAGGQPLILVDGIERKMSDIDFNEVESISVLKDASATAVFGVKGGNGVILITTKRGTIGKPKLTVSGNATMKRISKLAERLDSYDAIQIANEAILREIPYKPTAWNEIVPMEIAEKYRNPASVKESYIYPNVNWRDVILKDYAMDYHANVSVQGGSDFAQYYGNLAFQSVGDVFNMSSYPNNKGYVGEFNYQRFNYRSNLDFNITKTTKFSVNLSGFYGIQKKPLGDPKQTMGSLQILAPSVYIPIYPDNYYGRHISGEWNLENPLVTIGNSGYDINNTFQINGDFMLEQNLDFITKGLSFKAKLSSDNDVRSLERLNDPGSQTLANVFYRIYDIEGNEIILSPPGRNDFAYVIQPWRLDPMQIQDWTRTRRINYEISLNYNRIFNNIHNTSFLFLFKREEHAQGDMFPRYREDWVSRLTYDYDSKYFVEINGAYNGSEKFGRDYRFELFPSFALGWVLSNESFLSTYEWLDKLKIRGSYGLVGDDNYPGRWKYITQWGSGGTAYLVPSNMYAKSPYVWYKELSVGNPDLHWETSTKTDIGIELSVGKQLFTVDFDYFQEKREGIIIQGSERSIPDLYGIDPPDANLGKVKVQGFELVLGGNYTFSNNINVWSNYSFTQAKDKILYREDPALRPFYLKQEGYSIGQPRVAIPADIMKSWDDIYMSTPLSSDQNYRRLGYYDLVDFDGDGVYNSTYDNTPFGYPVRPQRTWTWTSGIGYGGLNFMFQFYGTQNATRYSGAPSFFQQTYLFFEHKLDYWSKDNPNSTGTLPAWSLTQANTDPLSDQYDASYVRLKTVEISYDIPKNICIKMGLEGLRVFVNGNNLYLWSDLPDDREFNSTQYHGETSWRGDYPTTKRFNFGFYLNF